MKNAVAPKGAENKFRNLGFGLGLRSQHYDTVINGQHHVEWFEAVTENYLGIDGGGQGHPLRSLIKVREKYPIVLHGVSMSLGSDENLNINYMKQLKELIQFIEPEWVSDHLAWTGIQGKNSHDLLPIPYNNESLKLFVEKIQQAQDLLQQQILIENPSSYIEFQDSTMTEWDFLNETLLRSGCALLLDVNNVFVSAHNNNFMAKTYIDALPAKAIQQIHLAGHIEQNNLFIDTHSCAVKDEVWALYQYTVRNKGFISTMVEWDSDIPEFSILENEIGKAREIVKGLNKNEAQSFTESVLSSY